MPTYHESIMKNEVLHYLNIHMEGVIVDGTLGDGGHTECILKNTGPKIKVLGIDRDHSAIERAEKRLHDFLIGEINQERIHAAHDVSEGGLLVCLAEMLFGEKRIGASFTISPETFTGRLDALLFGESQGRVVVAV